LFGALYFSFKYFIDKYNLTVIYPKEYESNGDISKNVLKLAQITLIFQQIIMFGLFVTTLNRMSFFWALIAFMLMQIIIKMILSIFDRTNMKEFFRKRYNFMDEDQE
jgi:hypothetical protein